MNSVWITKRKGVKGTTHLVRWIDPGTGRMRAQSAGTDRKLAKVLAAQRRQDLRRGICNDPIDVPWAEFTAQILTSYAGTKSAEYSAMTRLALDLFEMINAPRGPLRVDYPMIRRFIDTRLLGSRRCPKKACGFANFPDAVRCWRCERSLLESSSSMKVRTVNAWTVNKNLRALRAAFTEAKKLYRLPANPFDEVAALPTAEPAIRALSIDEQRRVLAACPDLRWNTYVYLGFTTRLRRKELARLQWEAVNLETRHITTLVKGHRLRTVRITQAAVDKLKALRLTHACPGVFVGDNGADFYWQIGKGLERIRIAAGVGPFTFHDTGRTFCTEMARAGVNQKTLSSLAGHSSMSTTSRYYQAVDDLMADQALDSLPLVQSETA